MTKQIQFWPICYVYEYEMMRSKLLLKIKEKKGAMVILICLKICMFRSFDKNKSMADEFAYFLSKDPGKKKFKHDEALIFSVNNKRDKICCNIHV